MTEQEALTLMNEGAAIDQGEAVHQEAAAEGRIDPRGQIVEADPDAAAKEWFLIPKIIAWAVTTVYPETAPAYTDDKCMELARAIVPVASKYGINGIGDSPELTLLMGCGMFGAPAFLAHKARQAEKAEATKAAKAGTAQDVVDKANNGG
jgi:hypothetical protein